MKRDQDRFSSGRVVNTVRQAAAFARYCADVAFDFVLPPACAWCGADLAVSGAPVEASVELCDICFERLNDAVQSQCERCAAPVGPHLDTALGCGYCRQDNFAFERVFSLGAYKEDLKHALMEAKQPFGAPLVASLAALLQRRCGATVRTLGIQLVIPVPHHWWDRLCRPHLPTITLATAWSRFLLVTADPHILGKRHRTLPQSTLSPAQRRQNLNHVFRVYGGARLDGLKILLVDDVLTTGTTAHQAARQLKMAGAEAVYVATIARGIGSDRLSTT